MDYKINQEIKLLEVKVNKYSPYYYAGASGDFNLIHIDNEFAKSVGLGGIILQGLCTMAYVCRGVMENKDPAKIKKLAVRFRQPVRPGDKLTVKGKIRNIENNLVTFDLLVENQKGEQVITQSLAQIES